MIQSGSAKICLAALLTAAVLMLQTTCVFIPVLGTFLSVFSTLLTAVSSMALKRRAVIVYLGAGLMMLAVSPHYALEYLMTTGLVGLTLGLRNEKHPALPLFVSGLIMFSGLCGLTYLLGTAAFGGILSGLSVAACLPVYAAFSAAYPALCLYILQRLVKTLVFVYCFRKQKE